MIELSSAEVGLEQRRFEAMATVTAERMELHMAEPLEKGKSTSGYRERQPIDWRPIAEKVLGLGDDAPMSELYPAVSESFEGWLPFVQERFSLDDKTMQSMDRARTAAYLIGTLTEDNLPGYVSVLYRHLQTAPDDVRDIFGQALGIWTAEEDAHLRAMGGFGELTDMFRKGTAIGLKGWSYSAARAGNLRHGSSEVPDGLTRMKVYTAIQEPMAQIAHTKDAVLHDPVGFTLLQSISEDEARHGRWFKAEVKALMPEFGADVIGALHAVITKFEMPGRDGIIDFTKLRAFISGANLLTTQDLGGVLSGVVSLWGIPEISGLSDMAKIQRDEIMAGVEMLNAIDGIRAKSGRFVLDQTVSVNDLRLARKEYLLCR